MVEGPTQREAHPAHRRRDLLTDSQKDRLGDLFAAQEHVDVEATCGICQRMIAASREPDSTRGRDLMTQLADPIRSRLRSKK